MRRDTLRIAEWAEQNDDKLPLLARILKDLSVRAEKAEQFETMKLLDWGSTAITTLLVSLGGQGLPHTSVDPAYQHNIERRAWRHIRLVEAQGTSHWLWQGSISLDEIPVMSVPKGWPYTTPASKPRYDPSTGTTVHDTSYAPPDKLSATRVQPGKLSKSNHTLMAVYRALWFVRKCDPTSPHFDPTASLAPRQRLLNVCGVRGQGEPPEPCVNPACYVKQAQSTARQALAAVRATLPAYATDAEVQQALAQTNHLCRKGRHRLVYNSRSGRYGRCSACRWENSEKRRKDSTFDAQIARELDQQVTQSADEYDNRPLDPEKDGIPPLATPEQLAEGQRQYAEWTAQQALAKAAQSYPNPDAPTRADGFAEFMSIPPRE